MKNNTAFLFSGQGSQYPGMMNDFFQNYKEAKAIFDMADNTLERSISNVCFNGTDSELNLTHNTQPCMLTAEIAILKTIQKRGYAPDALAGFSLGEYAALVAAEALTFEQAIKIVQIRADAMQDAVPVGMGGMAAVKNVPPAKVRELCESCKAGYVQEANFNSPGQIVVAGEKEAICELVNNALEQSIVAIELPVSAPFHSRMMDPAAQILEQALKGVTIKNTEIPIYLNVDAKPETDGEIIKKKLVLQAKSPVLWNQLICEMYNDGIRRFIEIGPGNTLLKFGKKIFRGIKDVEFFNINSVDDLEKIV